MTADCCPRRPAGTAPHPAPRARAGRSHMPDNSIRWRLVQTPLKGYERSPTPPRHEAAHARALSLHYKYTYQVGERQSRATQAACRALSKPRPGTHALSRRRQHSSTPAPTTAVPATLLYNLAHRTRALCFTSNTTRSPRLCSRRPTRALRSSTIRAAHSRLAAAMTDRPRNGYKCSPMPPRLVLTTSPTLVRKAPAPRSANITHTRCTRPLLAPPAAPRAPSTNPLDLRCTTSPWPARAPPRPTHSAAHCPPPRVDAITDAYNRHIESVHPPPRAPPARSTPAAHTDSTRLFAPRAQTHARHCRVSESGEDEDDDGSTAAMTRIFPTTTWRARAGTTASAYDRCLLGAPRTRHLVLLISGLATAYPPLTPAGDYTRQGMRLRFQVRVCGRYKPDRAAAVEVGRTFGLLGKDAEDEMREAKGRERRARD
ncbi:hypothetical protein B0H17DRAFT_1204566 [Mycena rosella]|uniref:Uncharacterized protein n=1 Tax=Mycena rosella TaxID=1033263 RepID=A0AAD7D8Y8_MYCRO|nr:hypothetical protein B0H17DRAFT_1204566 [Mycena rosella]